MRNDRQTQAVANALAPIPVRMVRCAIYTRKSTDEGLDQDFNSLDAQRDAAEAFILSQRGEGLVACRSAMTTVASVAAI